MKSYEKKIRRIMIKKAKDRVKIKHFLEALALEVDNDYKVCKLKQEGENDKDNSQDIYQS